MTAYDNWKTTDPSLEGPECPECGAAVEGDRWEWWCIEDSCTYHGDNLP